MPFNPDEYLKQKGITVPARDTVITNFDPDAYLRTKNITPEPTSKPFNPDEYLAQKVNKGEEGGWVVPSRVQDEQVKSIAAKYGVPETDLAEWVPYLGGMRQTIQGADIPKMAAGELGESIALGAPQFIAKKLQTPNMQRAVDELSSVVEHKKSTAQKGAELVGSVAGSLGLGKAVGKAIPALNKFYTLSAMPVGGAVSGVSHSRTGEEAESAAIGAAIGAAVPVVAGAAGNLVRSGAKKAADFLLTKQTTVNHIIDKSLEEQAPRIGLIQDLLTNKRDVQQLNQDELHAIIGDLNIVIPAGEAGDKILQDAANLRLNSIKKEISAKKTGDKSTEGFEIYARDVGEVGVNQAYVDGLKDKIIQEIAKDGTIRPLSRLERGMLSVLDAKPVYNIFDKRLGTSLGKSQDEASRKLIEADWAFAPEVHKANEAVKHLDMESSNKIISEIEQGNLTNPETRQWADIWKNLASSAKKLGIPLKTKENYVPSFRVPIDEYKIALAKRADEIGVASWDELIPSSPEVEELTKEITRGIGTVPKTAEEYKSGLNKLLLDDGSIYSRLDSGAASTKARDEALPAWIRDTNIVRLFNRWTNGIKKQYAISDHLGEVNRAAQLADYKGDIQTSDYLRKHMQDVLGTRTDAVSEFQKAMSKDYDATLEEQIAKAVGMEKQVLQGKSQLPSVLASEAAKNVYTNALGLSPKAALQNIASPLTGAIPDQGADYALKFWLEANADIAKTIRDGVEITLKPHIAGSLGKEPGDIIKTRNLNLIAFNEGLIGPNWQRELTDPSALNTKRSATLQGLQKVSDVYNKGMMALFEASEKMGRVQVAFMGKRLGDALVREPELVNKLIRSPSYRAELTQKLTSGAKPEDIRQLTTQYLNAHTLLNYDKLNMSEYGRIAGPFFRQFTKFPSFALGRMVQPFYEKGVVGGAAELAGGYLTPLAGFHAIDTALELEQDPRSQKVIGSNGLKGWAVGSSILPMFESSFGIQKTPLVGVVKDLATGAKSVASGKKDFSEIASNWLQKTYNTFGYGSGLLRFLGEDIPTLTEGEAPDRTTPPIERRLERIFN